MRGAPHVGFSAAIRKIRARISSPTGFRPPTCLALESHFQYKRKPARCHPTTVRGVTRTRGVFHPDQSRRRTPGARNPADEVPEPQKHGRNLIERSGNKTGPKSFTLRVHDILMMDKHSNRKDTVYCGICASAPTYRRQST